MLTGWSDLVQRRVDGRAVALARLMLGLALITITLESFATLALMADGRMTYPWFDGAPAPTRIVAMGVLVAGWLSGIALVIGILPSPMALVGSMSCLVTLLSDQQTYSSHLTLLTILLFLLTFARSDARWAVSANLRRDDPTVPFWPQLLMMTQVSVVYLFAGLNKIQPIFLSGRPLQEWMWPELPLAVFVVLSWGTVAVEVLLAVTLWVAPLRRWAMVAGIGLHLSIVGLLAEENWILAAFGLTMFATYPLFLTRPPVRPAAG